MSDEYNQLFALWAKLKELTEYKKQNALDFIDYSRYPEQTDIIERVVQRVRTGIGPKFFVIFGGNQSGKSEAGAIAVARVFKEVPACRIMAATIETRLSINVQQRKYAQYVRNNDILYGDYNPIRGWANSIIVGRKEQNLLFKTYAQGYEAFQGDEYDLIHFDEESPWDVFQEAIMRTVKRNGCILFTFTSLQGYTRIVNMLWQAASVDIYTTVLDLYMNPYIPKESKDVVAANIDPDEVESRIHGKPHLKEGLIYKEFGTVNVIEPFDFIPMVMADPKRYELHEGIDPHSRTPHHWARFLYDTKQDILYQVDELKAPRESMIVADYSRLIKMKRGVVAQKNTKEKIELKPRFTQIDTSSMTPEVISVGKDEEQEQNLTVRIEFARNGIQTVLVVKDNAVGINAVKDRLKVVRNQEGKIMRMPRLYIFNTCKGTIWEFSRYSWDSYSSPETTEKKEMINQPRKKDDHFMDLIKYECIKIRKTDNKPETYVEVEPVYGEMGY